MIENSGPRIAYGPHPDQFGELYLPPGGGPHPVVVFLHGGYWRARWHLGNAGGREMAAGLVEAGYAAWVLEYRRVGDPGGGWPGTFHDVAAGIAALRGVARRAPIDLARVTLCGHSAGGHLALWYAAAGRTSSHTPITPADPLTLARVVALAPVSDLLASSAAGASQGAADLLLGGTPGEQPARFAAASPRALLPIGTPVALVHGTADEDVPFAMSEAFLAAARAAGDAIDLHRLDGLGHFEPITPGSPAWPTVLAALRGSPPPG